MYCLQIHFTWLPCFKKAHKNLVILDNGNSGLGRSLHHHRVLPLFDPTKPRSFHCVQDISAVCTTGPTLARNTKIAILTSFTTILCYGLVYCVHRRAYFGKKHKDCDTALPALQVQHALQSVVYIRYFFDFLRLLKYRD